jgi:hypothetical protein
MIFMVGGMLGHPMGCTAGAMAFRQAIDATMAGVGLNAAARDKPELMAALFAGCHRCQPDHASRAGSYVSITGLCEGRELPVEIAGRFHRTRSKQG